MEKKITLKKITIGGIAALLLLFVLFFVILHITNRKPTAAFYGIPEQTAAAVAGILQSTQLRKTTKSEPYAITILDDSVPLEAALKKSGKPDLLFIYNGLNADAAALLAQKQKTGLPLSVLEGMVSSIRLSATATSDAVYTVPLLADNLEIDIKTEILGTNEINAIDTFSALDAVGHAAKLRYTAPIAFAAGDDTELINIIGALTESLSGADVWSSAVRKITESGTQNTASPQDFSELLTPMLTAGGEFAAAAELLTRWKAEGILGADIFQLKTEDLRYFISENLSAIGFMTLSQHRLFDRNVISQFSSAYYPSERAGSARRFTAPLILGIPLSKNKTVRKSLIALAQNKQDLLSAATGLSPVQAAASVPDVQADDARYWIAASGTPLPALSNAAFTAKAERTAFANALRTALFRIN